MLPDEYRISRAVNHLLIGHCWLKWLMLPPDWHKGGRLLHLKYGGRGGKPRVTMQAEIFDFADLPVKSQAKIMRSAQAQGAA
eukprot:1140220-Prymnesium_polylepis.1